MKNMVELNKTLKKFFLLVFVICSMYIHGKQQIEISHDDSLMYSMNIRGKQQFEIIHIDSIMNGKDSLSNNVYIVYCKDKNNDTYKVLTHYCKKRSKKKRNKIKEGEKYLLTLVSYFRRSLKCIGADYSLEIIGCNYYDNTVRIEPENCIFDLYETKELNGLFIK